jgi:hypothetical protein
MITPTAKESLPIKRLMAALIGTFVGVALMVLVVASFGGQNLPIGVAMGWLAVALFLSAFVAIGLYEIWRKEE